jgi:glycosyltransferase involved in cell wall biosynthesis/SAM-dependent methyltransferase
VVVVLISRDGKIEVLATVDVRGNPEDPWDPMRAEIKFSNFGDYEIKAFSMDNLKDDLMEGDTLIIYPKPTIPAGPPEAPAVEATAKEPPTHIAYITSIDEKCGVATYSKFLSDEVRRLFPVKLLRSLEFLEHGALVHLQHEFGIFPNVDDVVSKRTKNLYKVCTWHTVIREPAGMMLKHYHEVDLNYDAHIVHNDLAKKYLSAYTRKPIYVIPHGSVIFQPTQKDVARKALNLPLDRKIVFLFGFAAETKGFEEVATTASKLKDTLFIISGAIHDLLKEHGMKVVLGLKSVGAGNVLVLERYLSEGEINLYASAADVLLFNYKTPSFVSSASGALHRVLAAGKPIVCTVDNRLIELEDGVHALKYRQGDTEAMIHNLNLIFEDKDLAETLGRNARKLAEKTSWRNVAEMHIKVYNKVAGDSIRIGGFDEDYYDEAYFADPRGKKFNTGGKIETWGYKNPGGDWAGCIDIVNAWKKLFKPKTMLDVGCGRGQFVAYAREAGIEAYGFDYSKWALTKGLFYRCKPEWVFIQDATKPWKVKGKFDLCIALDFFEHIYEEDLDFVIDELAKATGKYAFLVIATTKEGEQGYILRKGEPVSFFKERRTWAGHVTVQSPSWWRERLNRSYWRFRDDLVRAFVNHVPKIFIKNWIENTIIVLEAL